MLLGDLHGFVGYAVENAVPQAALRRGDGQDRRTAFNSTLLSMDVPSAKTLAHVGGASRQVCPDADWRTNHPKPASTAFGTRALMRDRTINARVEQGRGRNSLAQAAAFHRLGRSRHHGLENQQTRATALNFVTAAITV